MLISKIVGLPEPVRGDLPHIESENGSGSDAELREPLATLVEPDAVLLMGNAMSAIARNAGLTNEDFRFLEECRETKPAEPLTFE